jgi:uncharacterized membrane protein YcaP (DUF421 family)
VSFWPLAAQTGLALAYYAIVLVLVRVAGKRLAGQMTTFDLVVLIGLVVVTKQATLLPGPTAAMTFIVTVLVAHRSIAWLCSRHCALRHFLRGRPRALVRDGTIIAPALRDEGLSMDELLAGLRKLGFESEVGVKLAVLEETGHISAIAADDPSSSIAAVATEAAGTRDHSAWASGQNRDENDDRDRDAQQP